MKHPRKKATQLAKFTLIELLVVIAIIAILAAILLPTLQNARESGKSAGCKNNMAQLGKLFVSYNDVNDDFYPLQYNKKYAGFSSWTYWIQMLNISAGQGKEQGKYVNHSNFKLAGQHQICPGDAGPADTYISYGYSYLWGRWDGSEYTYGLKDKHGGGNVKNKFIKNPSRLTLLVDSAHNQTQFSCYYNQSNSITSLQNHFAPNRHNKSANFVHADGHVSSEKMYYFGLYGGMGTLWKVDKDNERWSQWF